MILKKYNVPLNIFVCFEKLNVTIFTSDVIYKNMYVFFINKNFYIGINLFLRNEIFLNFLNLTEMSSIDTLKYNKNNNMEIIFKNNKLIHFNIYYCYFNKNRIMLITNVSNKIESIDKIFKNSVWLERETAEMFNVIYINKKDDRSLLLDYSRNDYPLLKNYPCEGFQEIYFDFFENRLNYVQSEMIEL